jgi:hypothetical protein
MGAVGRDDGLLVVAPWASLCSSTKVEAIASPPPVIGSTTSSGARRAGGRRDRAAWSRPAAPPGERHGALQPWLLRAPLPTVATLVVGGLRASFRRPSAPEHHQRGGHRDAPGCADVAGWTRELSNDAGVHRPRRRDFPRGGCAVRKPAFGATPVQDLGTKPSPLRRSPSVAGANFPLHGAAQESNLPNRGLHDRTGFEGSRRKGSEQVKPS